MQANVEAKEICKVSIRGLGADGGHVWTPGRGWPVGSDTVVVVIDSDEEPAVPAEMTANKVGEIRHPGIISRVTLRDLERDPRLSIKVVDGKAPDAPNPDALAGAIARAEIAEARCKEADSKLTAAVAANLSLFKANEGMGEKIRRLEAQVNGQRK